MVQHIVFLGELGFAVRIVIDQEGKHVLLKRVIFLAHIWGVGVVGGWGGGDRVRPSITVVH